MNSETSFLGVLKNRGFRYLWINQLIVQFVYNTINFALIIWVFKLTESSLAVSALMLAVYAPSFIFGLFAGIVVDLVDRKKIIVMVNILFAIACAAFIFTKDYYVLILLNTFFINSLAQFFMPTESSSIPLLVSKSQLFIANSLFSLTLYGSFMVGYSVAGPILNFYGIDAIFLSCMSVLLFALLISLALPTIRTSNEGGKLQNILLPFSFDKLKNLLWDEAFVTWKFITSKTKVAAAISLMAGLQGVIGVLAVLMPAYMEKILHIHATDASYFVILPLGLGMIFGVLMLGKFAINIPKRNLVISGVLGSGVIFLLAGTLPSILNFIQASELPEYIKYPRFFFRAPSLSIIFAAGAFVLGICTVAIIVPSQTVLQQNTDENIRGKIFAVLVVLMNLVAAVPVTLVGLFSDLFGVKPVFITIGIIITVIGIFALKPGLLPKERLHLKWREFFGKDNWV